LSLRLDLYARELTDLPHDLRWGRRHGAVWAELRRRTVDQLYERGRYAVLEQDVERLVNPAPPAGVTVRIGDDLAVLEPLTPRRTQAAFARREAGRFVVAWRGGEALGYEWWSPRLHPELDPFPVPLPPGTVLGHDLYVAPWARGQGIGTALAAARLADVRDHGFRTLRRLVAGDNAASWRTADRSAPVKVVGEAWFVRTPGRLRTGFDPA
jgi:ribosomal protein S18 acetylase RimI-like enzyme